jgi:hypothetical protein
VLIILTPHILRLPGITAENLRRRASGTDSNVRVFRDVSDDAQGNEKGAANPGVPVAENRTGPDSTPPLSNAAVIPASGQRERRGAAQLQSGERREIRPLWVWLFPA